jgi:hypothetical protein
MSLLLSSYPNATKSATQNDTENPWGYSPRWLADRKNKILQKLLFAFGCGNTWVSMARFHRFIEQHLKVAFTADCNKSDFPFSEKKARAARIDQMINKSISGNYSLMFTIEWAAAQAKIAENTARAYRLLLEDLGCYTFIKQAPGSTIAPPILEGVDLVLLSLISEVTETWLRQYAGLTKNWNPADNSGPSTCTDKARAEIEESLETQYGRDIYNRAFRGVAQYYREWSDEIKEMLATWKGDFDEAIANIKPSEMFQDFCQTIGNVFWGKIAFPRIKRFYFMHSPV